jgi:glycosyltransferase involved in cell wall biosynthesis
VSTLSSDVVPGVLGVSVVLPAHNEEAVIAGVVGSCLDVLVGLVPNFEVIVVDDGSVDHTGEIADAASTRDAHVRVVHNRPQRGYGGALTEGFRAARMPLVFFMDADGQFDIHDIAPFIDRAAAGCRAVLGYRVRREDSLLRRLNAWGWNLLVRHLFKLQVRDVDCAFKLYDTSLVRLLDVHAGGAMVNAEMLAKLRKLDVRVVQLPVSHHPRRYGRSTGANPRVIAHAFRELSGLATYLRDWQPPAESWTPWQVLATPATTAETKKEQVLA